MAVATADSVPEESPPAPQVPIDGGMATNHPHVDDLCSEKTPQPDDSKNKDFPQTPHPDGRQKEVLGHQGVQGTGGKDVRVLYCTGVDLSLDYQELYLLFKQFGTVERLRLSLATNKSSFVCYAVFSYADFAATADKQLNGHYVNDLPFQTRLISICKFQNNEHDYIPSNRTDDTVPYHL